MIIFSRFWPNLEKENLFIKNPGRFETLKNRIAKIKRNYGITINLPFKEKENREKTHKK